MANIRDSSGKDGNIYMIFDVAAATYTRAANSIVTFSRPENTKEFFDGAYVDRFNISTYTPIGYNSVCWRSRKKRGIILFINACIIIHIYLSVIPCLSSWIIIIKLLRRKRWEISCEEKYDARSTEKRGEREGKR